MGLREGENSWRAADEGQFVLKVRLLKAPWRRATALDSGDFGFSRSIPGTMSAARASLRASIELL